MPASDPPKRRGPSWGHAAKRWLFLIHRWIGIGSCLLFAIWFASGLVMIYVPYPSLSLNERLAGAQAIDWRQVDVPPPIALNGMPRSLELEMRDGVPVWRVQDWEGKRLSFAARQGVPEPVIDRRYAGRVANSFSKKGIGSIEQIERDQWTVAGGFNAHRPLWKVSLADKAGTQLYVSSSSGAVVQRTTANERFWNWLGSVPHWIYPTVLRQEAGAWRQVVLWVSGPCIAAAITGIWIGILRTRVRERRFKGGRMTPYHGWMLWHHVAGLVGGVTLTMWIFSGWLSVDPGYAFTSPDPPEGVEQAYMAGSALPPLDMTRLARAGDDARLARFSVAAGIPVVTLFAADGTRTLLTLPDLRPAGRQSAAIARAAARLVPAGRIAETAVITEPDTYYYEVGGRPRLPALRLRFDDPAKTWLYLDPATGEILNGLDARRRTYRWLYDFFHRWDLNLLLDHRPARDIVLWLFSIAGMVTSVTGIWVGWKRLTRRTHAKAARGM